MDLEIEKLKGKVIQKIERDKNESINFVISDTEKYKMYHNQDCCENVSIEDVVGDLEDLVGSEVLQAEEAISREQTEEIKNSRRLSYEKDKAEIEARGGKPPYDNFEEYQRYNYESETWTFYKIATIKGSVTIRWHGSSSGYYSESVDFERVES